MTDRWTARHFSLANPSGDRETDLPHLLRRVADQIEANGIDPTTVLDLTVGHEITENGPRWHATVYWAPDDPPDPRHP